MPRITNIGGFLSLIYIWYNYKTWSISPNTTNLVSSKFIEIIMLIPQKLISITRIIILITLFLNILLNRRSFIITQISRILFVLIMLIGCNMLMLEETTTLYLLKLHHPLAITYKYEYFEHTLSETLISQNLNIIEYKNKILELPLTNEILGKLKIMNIMQINEAVIKIVNLIIINNFENVKETISETNLSQNMTRGDVIITSIFFIIFCWMFIYK